MSEPLQFLDSAFLTPNLLSEEWKIEQPPPPKWTLQFCGNADLTWYLHKAPNRFHRWMQHVAFGFVWTRLP